MWSIGGGTETVTPHLGPGGQLRSVLVQRWGTPDGSPFARAPFGVTVQSERTVDGVTLPTTFRAGWWWGTDRQDDGELLRATLTGVEQR